MARDADTDILQDQDFQYANYQGIAQQEAVIEILPVAGSSNITTINGGGGGSVTGPTVTLSGGTTGLTFIGSGTTITESGVLVAANGGTGTATPTGVYTPTLTNVANLDGSTAFQCQWMRVNDMVTVSGKVSVDPTAAAASTELGISLPIASNLGAQEDCAGTAFASGIAGQGAAIRGDAANNRAELVFIAADVTNQPMYFSFLYQII